MSNTLTTNKILLNELQNTLNELINRNDLSVKTTELSNELLETTKIIENCTSCKDKKIDGNYIDKIENCLAELEQEKKKEDIIKKLNDELNKIDFELNKEILCQGCERKKIGKLTDKCGNEEIARFLYYDCKLNAEYYDDKYIRWIPFDEIENIKYLDNGEVHMATLSDYYDDCVEKLDDVELKRMDSNDKIVDILKEVKQKFVIIFILKQSLHGDNKNLSSHIIIVFIYFINHYYL